MVPDLVISDEDKVGLKSSVLLVFDRLNITKEERALRKTYCEVVHHILRSDFPQKWPNLLELLLQQSEQATDISAMLNVLQVLYLLVSTVLI